jgi:hypothetical protein
MIQSYHTSQLRSKSNAFRKKKVKCTSSSTLTGRIQDIGMIMETRTVLSTKSKIRLRQPWEIVLCMTKCRLDRHNIIIFVGQARHNVMCGGNWKQRLVVVLFSRCNTKSALFPAVEFGASALSPPVYTIRLILVLITFAQLDCLLPLQRYKKSCKQSVAYIASYCFFFFGVVAKPELCHLKFGVGAHTWQWRRALQARKRTALTSQWMS